MLWCVALAHDIYTLVPIKNIKLKKDNTLLIPRGGGLMLQQQQSDTVPLHHFNVSVLHRNTSATFICICRARTHKRTTVCVSGSQRQLTLPLPPHHPPGPIHRLPFSRSVRYDDCNYSLPTRG